MQFGRKEVKRNCWTHMPKLEKAFIEGEKFYYNFSFDIDDFIGDGIWWLQIYDINHCLIYDIPFASSMFNFDEKVRKQVRKIIKYEILNPRGLML